MQTWTIGNTTVRNPRRIADALGLFIVSMGGRPFDRAAQGTFQGRMIAADLVEARVGAEEKRDYESGARKFASCFKQLGLVTDWAKGRAWTLTPVGQTLLTHQVLEETLFLRQLLKYQLPSPLERARRLILREVAFAHDHHLGDPLGRLAEIREVLERVTDPRSELIGGQAYKPALLEWATWRLFLVIDHIVGPISQSRNFLLDDDLNPAHHARGGVGDLVLTFGDFTLVVELTLLTGSRQFAAEGEPVTRHVYRQLAAQAASGRPVYGLFIAPAIDPNTADLYHRARYWADDRTPVPTPVVALTIKDILTLIERLLTAVCTPGDLRRLIEGALALQEQHTDGPAWQRAIQQDVARWISSLPPRAS